jgi:hypothetical protein
VVNRILRSTGVLLALHCFRALFFPNHIAVSDMSLSRLAQMMNDGWNGHLNNAQKTHDVVVSPLQYLMLRGEASHHGSLAGVSQRCRLNEAETRALPLIQSQDPGVSGSHDERLNNTRPAHAIAASPLIDLMLHGQASHQNLHAFIPNLRSGLAQPRRVNAADDDEYDDDEHDDVGDPNDALEFLAVSRSYQSGPRSLNLNAGVYPVQKHDHRKTEWSILSLSCDHRDWNNTIKVMLCVSPSKQTMLFQSKSLGSNSMDITHRTPMRQ